MPTHDETRRFWRDFAGLTPEQAKAFRRAVKRFVEDLPAGKFRKSLRVKGVEGTEGVFEMTWAADGRATFEYGPERIKGETHILWRRVGTHDVLGAP